MKILIIIPAYNEEENIQKVINNIIVNYPQYDYIIVNDTVESAQADLEAIVRAAKCSYMYKKEFVNEVLEKC